jgi:hypothetical protein
MNNKEERSIRPLLTIRCKQPMHERRHQASEMIPMAARSVARPPPEPEQPDPVSRVIHVMRRGTMFRSHDGLQWTPEPDPDVPALPEGGVRITMEE